MNVTDDDVVSLPNAGDRATAAVNLGGRPATRRRVQLLRAALDDSDYDVRDQAAASLAVVHDIESVPRMIELLDSTPPRLGRSIAWGLARLVDEADPEMAANILAALHRYRARSRGETREHATELLIRIGSIPVPVTRHSG